MKNIKEKIEIITNSLEETRAISQNNIDALGKKIEYIAEELALLIKDVVSGGYSGDVFEEVLESIQVEVAEINYIKLNLNNLNGLHLKREIELIKEVAND